MYKTSLNDRSVPVRRLTGREDQNLILFLTKSFITKFCFFLGGGGGGRGGRGLEGIVKTMHKAPFLFFNFSVLADARICC